MPRSIKIYYGMSGTFKATTIESALTKNPKTYYPMWSDIKPWKYFESRIFKDRTEPNDLNLAMLHLCRLRNYVQGLDSTRNLLVERGVSDMVFYYLKNHGISESVEEDWIKKVIHEELVLCEGNSYYIPEKVLLIQKDVDFIEKTILNEPTRKEQFPNLQAYLEAQDNYIEFTKKYNDITDVKIIKDAEQYINSLGFEFDQTKC